MWEHLPCTQVCCSALAKPNDDPFFVTHIILCCFGGIGSPLEEQEVW